MAAIQQPFSQRLFGLLYIWAQWALLIELARWLVQRCLIDESRATAAMRARVGHVFKYEHLMLLGSLAIYYTLKRAINVRRPRPQATTSLGDYVAVELGAGGSNGGHKAHGQPAGSFVLSVGRRRVLMLLLLTLLLAAHASFPLYWLQAWTPVALHWFTAVSLGLWIHVCPLLALVVCTQVPMSYARVRRLLPGWLQRWLARPHLLCCMSLAAAISLCAIQLTYVVIAPYSVREERVALSKHRLPASAERMRLMLLSDIHLGGVITRRHINALRFIITENMPDAVVFAGDLFDGAASQLADQLQPLEQITSRKHGFYFVSGNHEYYYDRIEDYYAVLRGRLRMTVLHNKAKDVNGVCLAGIDDLWLRQNLSPANQSAVYSRMFAESDCAPGAPTVTVIHNPYFAAKLTEPLLTNRTDLIVSGHVHAGQFYILAPMIWWSAPLFYGWYSLSHGMQAFVSAGVHFFDVPMKMLGYQEIVIFTLVNSS